MNLTSFLQTGLIFCIPVLLAITLHEVAHGYVALKLGDNTASNAGRLTLNPLSHIDPLGTIVLPLLLLWSTHGAYALGYARPVPVNFGRLRNPRSDILWVVLAGPVANLLQALGWGLLFTLLSGFGVHEQFFLDMTKAGILVNLIMAAFNLFPIPPLDGGRVLVALLPARQALALTRVEPWGFFIALGLLLLNVISDYWINPLVAGGYSVLHAILQPIASLLN